MVNHGLVVAPLFFIVALLAERSGGSDDIREMGGIAFRAPVLAALFLISALATLAMPGSANFVGEFFILLGLFSTKIVYSIVAFTGVVMASVYMLRMFIRTMHNRLAPGVESRDLTLADTVVIAPLVLCILALAVYPQQAMTDSERTVKAALAKGQRAAGNPSTIASVGRPSP
jgi:NADH-quinone oxidoreductase subunit M